MRFIALVPILTFFLAIILSFLAVFAGSRPGVLQQYDLFTVNTSKITLNPSLFTLNVSLAQTGGTGLLGNLLRNFTSQVNNLTATIERDFQDVINSAVQQATHDLGVEDFYSFYLMDFCRGSYANTTGARDVHNCTAGLSLTNFNLSSLVTDGLRDHTVNLTAFNVPRRFQQFLNANGINVDLTIPRVPWLDDIDDGLHSLGQAVQVIYGFLIADLVILFLSFIGSLIGVLVMGKWLVVFNLVMGCLAWVLTLVWAIIATVISYEGASLVNQYGSDNNVVATRGTMYLAFPWTSFVAALLGWAVWVHVLVADKRRAKGTGHSKSTI